MYILTNRQNVIIDILNEVRYIKRQSLSGITIACKENEGTGVIGSDCDTHYPLIKSDTKSDPRAVNVIQLDEIPSDVINTIYKETKYTVEETGGEPFSYISKTIIPNLYKYENGEFTFVHTLDEMKAMKQEENKVKFAEYLASHPLTWVDGKKYGITQEDQSEISLNLNQYQIAVAANVEMPILEWHAQHEECTAWKPEELFALSIAITEAVYPFYHKMQQYKTDIYACATIKELQALNIDYEAVD